MGLLDKHRLERKKYISVAGFINLIAFIKNEMVTDIISYFVINDLEKHITSYNIDLHGRILDSGHIEKYGFDLNTRLFLEEGSCTFFFEHYITYLNSNKMKKHFYYLKDELNSIDFIKELNLDFNLQAQADKAVSKWNNEQKEDKIYRTSEKADFNKPNDHQLGFFKQDEFSIIDAACLLAGVDCSSVIHYQNHPEFTQVYDDYISYKLMLELAIDNDELYCLNGTIATIILQKYLFNIGYIIKGFNDWLTIEPAKSLVDNKPSEQLEASHNELKEAQAKINELENKLSQAQEAKPKFAVIPFGKRLDFISKDLPQSERIKKSYELCSDDISFYEDTHPVNTPDEMIKRIQGLLKVIRDRDSKISELEKQTNTPNNAQDKIDELENQLAQAKAELTDNPADEVELNPKTQTAVTRLLNVLFHKAQLDITAHKGTTNKNIVNSSISLNAKITEKPVSHWIKQVQQLRIDTEKR